MKANTLAALILLTLTACSGEGGTGVGYFASTITGLGGCGVVYYVRAYATNATGTAYGNQNTVSTGLLPTVATAPVTAIGFYDATSGGTIADNGGCAIAQKGVVWSWNPTPLRRHRQRRRPGRSASSGQAPGQPAAAGGRSGEGAGKVRLAKGPGAVPTSSLRGTESCSRDSESP